ncbi:MAG: hypothetical protein LBD86_05265 [Spirochaetaceae bacterium]|jgi:hypothetical protein|nr:hypothetical protein [Spirochaetaceae bacterium]
MKIRNFLTNTIFLAALVFTACEQEPPEEGPEIEVSGAADFAKIGKYTSHPLSGNYRLTADVTLTAWTPLGSASRPFTGTFNGGGHTITITSGSGGFFDTLDDAVVRNLAVDVTAEKTGGSVGGITAFVYNSLIESCRAVVNFTLTGNAHNNSAGGIAGMMGNYSTVRGCTASGTITLTAPLSGEDDANTFMVYAGGIAGYSGSPGLAGSNESGCLIERSSWEGTVSATSSFPYAGGVVGYNYSGAVLRRCRAEGSVTATGGHLPYAGGVAGYNSRLDGETGTPSTIEDCYSTATVTAVSRSKAALAGGVAGANAAGALISRCYATGAVTARVAGDGTENLGGSIGVMIAANAGGIAGAQYVTGEFNKPPTISACAALNAQVKGEDSAEAGGASWNVYRIAGAGSPAEQDTGVFTKNIAWSGMTLDNHTGEIAAGKDGEECVAKPAQSAYTVLEWNFNSVWRMGDDGLPALR